MIDYKINVVSRTVRPGIEKYFTNVLFSRHDDSYTFRFDFNLKGELVLFIKINEGDDAFTNYEAMIAQNRKQLNISNKEMYYQIT